MIESRGVSCIGVSNTGAERLGRPAPRSRAALVALLLAGAATSLATQANATALDVNGTSQTVGGLSGGGNVINNAGPATLTIDILAGTFSQSGSVNNGPGAALRIVKTGAGRQDFNGAGTYTGGTEIAGGTLGFGTNSALGTGLIEFTNASAILRATSAGLTLANDILLTTDGTLSGAGLSPTFTGLISGGGKLTKAGGGTMTLANAVNTYTGGTDLFDGRLVLGGDGSIGNGALTVTGLGVRLGATTTATLNNAVILNERLTVDLGTVRFDGLVSGNPGNPFALSVDNGATLILGGANTYVGRTQIDNGSVLGIANSNAIANGVGSILIGPAGGTLRAYADGLTVANDARASGVYTIDANGFGLTVSGQINDTFGQVGSLVVTGFGSTLTLSNASNGYSGGTTVQNFSRLSVSSDAQLGSGGAGVTLDNAFLEITGNSFTNLPRVLTLSGIGGVVDVIDPANIVTLGLVQGTGLFQVNGPGTVVLGAGNTYAGETVVNGGTLRVTANDSISGATLYLNHGTFQAGVSGLSFANTVELFIAPVVDSGAGNLTLSGPVQGIGSLTKTGSGWLSLSSANTYTGGTIVSAGEIRAGNNTSFGTNSVDLATGTTLSTSVAGLTIANAIILDSGTQTINPGAAGTLTLTTGGISGNGGFFKTGSARLWLSGPNTYSGGTEVVAGELRVDSSTGTGSTQVNSGATLSGTGSLAATTFILSGGAVAPGSSPGTINFVNLDLASGSFLNFDLDTPGIVGGGVNDLIIVSGSLTLDGTLIVNPLGGFGAGTYRIFNYTGGFGDNTLLVGALPGGFTGTINLLTPGQVNLTILGPGGGPFSYWDGANFAANNVVNGGTGTWSVAGTNWTNAGGTANGAWTGTTAFFQGTAGVVNLTSGFTFDRLQFDVGGYALGDGGGGSLVLSGNDVVETNGIIGAQTGFLIPVTGSGTLVKEGANVLDLVQNNSYSGGTIINQGIVRAYQNDSLGTGTVTMANGTSLDIVTDGVALPNAFTINGTSTVRPYFGVTATLNGQISGTGTLRKQSTGTLVLANNSNNYSGGTEINAGTLAIASDGALGAFAPLTFTGTSTLRFDANVIVFRPVIFAANATVNTNGFDSRFDGGFISETGGARSLTKNGAGQLTLNGTSDYSGGTFINQGAVLIDDGSSIGSGAIFFGANTTLIAGDPPGEVITLANDIGLNGPATIDVNGTFLSLYYTGNIVTDGADLTLNGLIGGGGPLTLTNFGKVTLGAANTYNGGTIIDNVAVAVTGNGSLGSGDVTFTGASVSGLYNNTGSAITLTADIALNNTDTALGGSGNLTLSGNLVGGSTIYKVGGGTLNLTGDNSGVGGNTYAGGGTLLINGNYGTGGAQLFVLNGGTLGGSGTINADVAVDGGGVWAPGNSPGTVVIIGNLAFNNASVLNYELGQSGVPGGLFNDRTIVNGNLTLDGILNVTDSFAFGLGVYNLFTYTGALTDNTLDIGTLPGAFTGIVQAAVPGLVNLIISAPGVLTQYWDGTDFVGNGVIDGGNGTWNNGNTNWATGPTPPPALLNSTWQGGIAVFQGATGAVNITQNQSFQGLQFSTDGYVLSGVGGLTANGATFIATDPGVTATINTVIGGVGGSINKQNDGTLILNGVNTYDGGTTISGGVLQINSDSALGAALTSLTFAGPSTLRFGANLELFRPVILDADGTIDTNGFNGTVLGGFISGGPANSLTKVGAGQLTLTGTSLYQGGTNLDAGSLRIERGGSIGTGRLTTMGGTTLVAGLGAGMTGLNGDATINLANDVTLGAGTTTIDLIGTTATLFVGTGVYTSPGTDLTLSGPIDGDGGLTTANFGTLTLTGNNSYTGGTTATDITVFVGNDNAFGFGAVTLNGASLQNNSGTALAIGNDIAINATAGFPVGTIGGNNNLELSGALSGAGGFAKIGSDVVNLSGDGTAYSGNATVESGKLLINGNFGAGAGQTLIVRDSATLGGTGIINANVTVANSGIWAPGNSPGTITVNGNLVFNNSSILNYELGQASVPGGLFNDRTIVNGNLTLDGILNVTDSLAFGLGVYNLFTYTGALTDNTLSIGTLPGAFTGIVQAAVPGFVNLIITMPGVLTQYWDGGDFLGNGVIDGGNGTWNNGNTNWATGPTPPPALLNSTWQGGIAVFQGATGAVNITQNQSFQGMQFSTNGYVLSGVGGLTANSATFIATDFGVTATINTVIGGVGGSINKQNGGTLILNGPNTYTGGTTITGGVLQIGNNSALGSGLLTIGNGTILRAGVSGLVIANAVATPADARIDSGPGTFRINGDITGLGSISQIGTGDLQLYGNNSFAAGLGINQGTVTLGTNTAAGTGQIAINNGAILNAGISGLVIENSIETTADGRVNSGPGTFRLNGDIGGLGSISQIGTGDLQLYGNNSFAAGLGINLGTVTLGSNTAAGSGEITINGGARLVGLSGITIGNHVETTGAGLIAANSGTFTINGTIGGPGSLTHTGLGNLALNGANDFAGGLRIAAGRVTLGDDDAAGTGTIIIDGNATLAAGTPNLMIANNIVTTGAAIINTNGENLFLNGTIGGAGSLDTFGGNLYLTASNGFLGGLNINAGRVSLGTNTAAGSGLITINNGSTLAAGADNLMVVNNIQTTGASRIDTAAFTFTLSGMIGGTGGITKVGTGTLRLTGTSNYSGGTTVSVGRLLVNGALTASTVTVANGATLGGSGSVAGIVVQAGGTVSPGQSVGTLNVSGPVTFAAGSTYLVEIAGVTADRITATGAATLNGANLVADGSAAAPVFNTTYTVLSAAGGRTGTFTPVLSGFSPAFAPTLNYSPTEVTLRLNPASIVGLLGSGAGGSSNIVNFANALDASVAAGFNPQNFFPIYLQSGAALAGSLNQLTGEINSANSRTAMSDTRYVREAALDRLGASLGGGNGRDATTTRGTDDNNITFWARGVGSWTDSDGDGNGSKLSIDAKGVITGIDYSFGEWKVGALFNYIESDVDTRGLGSGKVKSTGGGAYFGYRGDAGIAFGIGGAASSVKASERRSITVPGIAQSLRGRSDGTSYQGFAEISYDLAASANARVEPFVRGAYVAYNVDRLTESGGFAALNVAKAKYDTTVLTAGVRGSVGLGGSALLRGSAGYQRTWGDRTPVAQVSLIGTAGEAAIRAVPVDKDAFAGELGVDFRIGNNVTLGGGYSGVIGKNTQDHGVKGTLTVGF